MVPELPNPENLNFVYLFMVVSGFIALTVCYVIAKEYKKWTDLDNFSKLIMSLIVGALSYYFISTLNLIYRFFRFTIYKEPLKEFQFNIYWLSIMTIYAIVIIGWSYRRYVKKDTKHDIFSILKFAIVTVYFALFFILLLITTIFVYLIFLGFFNLPIWIVILLVMLALIFLYITYSSLNPIVVFFTRKVLPYNFKWTINKIVKLVSQIDLSSLIYKIKTWIDVFVLRLIRYRIK